MIQIMLEFTLQWIIVFLLMIFVRWTTYYFDKLIEILNFSKRRNNENMQ
jgi:hypothetical protein